MNHRQDIALAITTPPPSSQHVQGAAPRILHLPVRGDSPTLAEANARAEKLRGCRCDRPARGCSVNLLLTWTPEADELIDSVIEAGFDTTPDHERALIEMILVVDMAAGGAQEAILQAIDDVPGVRAIAIANTHQQEQDAWQSGAHVVVAAPVDPQLLVRLITRCAAELDRERLLRDLAEKVRTIREKEERRAEERAQATGRVSQRALTMAAFKAHLLAETLLASCDKNSVRVQLSRELCSSLAQAVSSMLDTPQAPLTGPVAMELRRMNELLREGVIDLASARRAIRSK